MNKKSLLIFGGIGCFILCLCCFMCIVSWAIIVNSSSDIDMEPYITEPYINDNNNIFDNLQNDTNELNEYDESYILETYFGDGFTIDLYENYSEGLSDDPKLDKYINTNNTDIEIFVGESLSTYSNSLLEGDCETIGLAEVDSRNQILTGSTTIDFGSIVGCEIFLSSTSSSEETKINIVLDPLDVNPTVYQYGAKYPVGTAPSELVRINVMLNTFDITE